MLNWCRKPRIQRRVSVRYPAIANTKIHTNASIPAHFWQQDDLNDVILMDHQRERMKDWWAWWEKDMSQSRRFNSFISMWADFDKAVPELLSNQKCEKKTNSGINANAIKCFLYHLSILSLLHNDPNAKWRRIIMNIIYILEQFLFRVFFPRWKIFVFRSILSTLSKLNVFPDPSQVIRDVLFGNQGKHKIIYIL